MHAKGAIPKLSLKVNTDLKKREFSTRVSHTNSRVAERVAPQASLAPAQAPLARGALSERLVPPFLQSVSLACKYRVI